MNLKLVECQLTDNRANQKYLIKIKNEIIILVEPQTKKLKFMT
jgi:hypothetical protein